MTCKVNADTTNGLKLTSDTSGVIDLQTNGTTKVSMDTSGNLQFDSGYGSVVTAYGVRAWVNFNGTGTVAIRESGGVSSVADRGTGQYTVVLSTVMPDNNYCGVTSAIHDISSSTNRNRIANAFTKDTNEVYVNSFDTGGNASDVEQVNVVIVR